MNCKPKDLARVINDQNSVKCGMVDKVIKITEADGVNQYGSTYWKYEPPLLVCKCGCNEEIESIADSVLRPINGGETPEESIEAMRLLNEVSQGVPA